MKTKASFVFLLFFICNLYALGCNNEKNVIYNIIAPTASHFEVIRQNVSRHELKGNYYQKVICCDGHIRLIKHYNAEGRLFDDIHIHAIISISYDESNDKSVLKFSIFDKENKPVTDDFRNFSSIIAILDENERIVEQRFLSQDDELISYHPDIGTQAPIVKYSYKADEIKAIKLNREQDTISTNIVRQPPCIPFINCNDHKITCD